MVKILEFLKSLNGGLVTAKIIADKLEMNITEVLRILRLLRGMTYVTQDKSGLWTITQAGVDRLNKV